MQTLRWTVFISLFVYGVRCNVEEEIDEKIYNDTLDVLKTKFPKDEVRVVCVLEDFKKNKVIDKFYTAELLQNKTQLEKEILPYLPEAQLSCPMSNGTLETSDPVKTPSYVNFIILGAVFFMLFVLAIVILCLRYHKMQHYGYENTSNRDDGNTSSRM